jgi:hypothetical protein
MKWYEDLYVGDSIADKANRIKWKINHIEGLFLSSGIMISPNYTMDLIYQMTQRRNIACIVNLHQLDVAMRYATRIIGLAKGYAEALELVCSIIEEVYQNTGDVDVKSYLRGRKRRRQV